VQRKPRILVAPLDWGLGHASRCIPIIRALIKQDIEPVLGGSSESLLFLKGEFPELEQVVLPGYDIQYSKTNTQLPKIALQIPRLIKVINQEKKLLNQIIDQRELDAVISDNRYGLYSPKIPSIFVCHQLSLSLPRQLFFFSGLMDMVHHRFISHFDQCWVPDFEGENGLAGRLSQQALNIPQHFIGPLSRFNQQKEVKDLPFSDLPSQEPEILVIMSGPEPQRSLLEAKIRQQARDCAHYFWIIQGKAGYISYQTEGNCERISFLDSPRLSWAFSKAKGVISRSGYSSLMDYEALGLSNVFLIPTPGQTEQEYLAKEWKAQGRAIVQSQAELDIRKGIEEMDRLSPGKVRAQKLTGLLEEAILRLKKDLGGGKHMGKLKVEN